MINNLKKHKAFYIVLSILLAIVLWAYVVNVENPDIEKTVSDIPVTFLGENALAEENLMVTSDKTATISLRLQGKRQTLTQLSRDNITITADLSKLMTTGLHQVAYELRFPSYITVGGNVTILDRSSNYVDVTLGRMVTKTVPVEVRFEGNVASGYVGDELQISPNTIEISGEEQAIAKVKSAHAVLAGKDLTETLTADLTYQLMDLDGNEVSSNEIQKNVETVSVTLPVVVAKDIPLKVALQEGGGAREEHAEVEIEPASIVLSGGETELKGLESIVIGTVDLARVISSGEMEFAIPLPENVKNVSGVETAKVSVTIEGLETQTVQVTDLDVINVPSGRTAALVTKSLEVMVRGTEEALALVRPYNLRAVADLSELTGAVGDYNVPVTVTLTGTGGAGVVGEYKAVVSIRR